MRLFERVSIIGVGLIGGSLGLSLRKRNLAKEVVGIFRKECSRQEAVKRGAVDWGTRDKKRGLQGADLVIIATPVGRIVEIVKRIRKFLKEDCIIIDVGSTKSYILQELERILPKSLRFIGCHPLAGSQAQGVQAASDKLFEGSLCILTPTKNTDRRALNLIRRMWRELGARIRLLSPQEHDRAVSLISHLPQVIAFSLVDAVPPKLLKLAAGGFKDLTRIASSSPVMWRDIFLTNTDEVLNSIDNFQRSLRMVKELISKRDAGRLYLEFKRIKKKRERYK